MAASESMASTAPALPTVKTDPAAAAKAERMIAALSGLNNLRIVDLVALTRLRVEVTDASQVNDAVLTDAGVQAVMRVEDQVLHLVVGLNAEQYANAINQHLKATA